MSKSNFIKNGLSILLLIVFLAACSSSSSDEAEVMKLGKEYKIKQFTVELGNYPEESPEVHEAMRPYLTEKKYKTVLLNREALYPAWFAQNANKGIAVEDMTFKRMKNAEGMQFDYELKLRIIGEDEEHEISKIGEMAFEKEDGQWRISRDSDQKLTMYEMK